MSRRVPVLHRLHHQPEQCSATISLSAQQGCVRALTSMIIIPVATIESSAIPKSTTFSHVLRGEPLSVCCEGMCRWHRGILSVSQSQLTSRMLPPHKCSTSTCKSPQSPCVWVFVTRSIFRARCTSVSVRKSSIRSIHHEWMSSRCATPQPTDATFRMTMLT